MPRGDGTGPMGAGPMTGRALGYCAGFGAPGFARIGGLGRGRGGGFGRGIGRGWGRGGWGGFAPVAAPPAATQKQWLESEAQALQTQLDEVRQRLSELEAEKK